MKLTLAEPKLLKESISIISDLVAETRIRVTKNILELISVDRANVAMVIFRMPSSSFSVYDVKEDVTLAINLGNFKQVLRRAKPKDVMTLEAVDGKLKIILKEKNVRTFYLPLIDLEDIEEKEQRVPNFTAKAEIEMPSERLNEAIEDTYTVGECATFEATENKLIISAIGDVTKAEVAINADNSVKIKTEGQQKSKYSIEYLKKIIQGSKLATRVTIKFSKEYPLTLEYKKLDKLSLTFILAPIVEEKKPRYPAY